MAGTAVLLLCVFFLGLTDTTTAQETTETSTLPTVATTTDFCFSPWNISVDRDFTIIWDGVDREATILVNIEPIESYGDDCLTKTSFTAGFRDKVAPPIPDPYCFNSVYQVDVKLICDNIVAHNYTTQVRTEPDAPPNVRVTNVTTSSFLVVWDEPPGKIDEYKVTVDSLDTHTTSDTYLDVRKLQSNTEYKIQVSARNSLNWGKWSDEVRIETKEIELPTPQNLQHLDVTNTTIEVTWDEVSFENYPIFYTLRFGLGSVWSLHGGRGLNTSNSSFTVKRLKPYTEYFIRVRACTVGATGNWTEAIAVRTLPGVPSEPENVTVAKVDSISIHIQWNEPSPSTGPIQFYTVEWTDSTNPLDVQKANTEDQFYTIKNLIPSTSYDIWLSATTEAGIGNWTSPVQKKTNPPEPPENLRYTNKTSSSVTLGWDEPQIYRGKGIIVGYSVRWNKLSFPKKISPYTSELSMTVYGLEPKTKYSFEVQSWSRQKQGLKAAGEWSQSLMVETDVGVPPPPVNVRKGLVSNSSIEVKWDMSAMYKDLVILHTVEWNKMDDGNNSTKTEEGETANTTGSSFIIKNLEAFTNYSIRVKSWTEDGAGDWAYPVTVQTDIGVPFPPSDVQEVEVTNTTILVKWEEPVPRRGPIEMYVVEWREEGSTTRILKSSDSTFFLIKELTPCRNYIIRVSAKTEAGIGNWSDPITVSTTTGLPLVPRNVLILSPKTDSIEISWEEPEPHMGNIVSYFIRWGERGSNMPFSDVTNDTSYIIRNLSAYTWYSVQVQAGTEAGEGEWSKPEEGRTAIGIPSLPRKFQEKKSTNTSIEVKWKEPNPTNGPITNYTVRWANLDNDLTKSDTTAETTYLIKQLEPYTNYSVQVRAATAAGFGKWTQPLVIRTGIGVPLKPRNVTTVTVTDTSIHLKWEEPTPVVGYVTHYDVEWTDETTNSTATGKVETLYYIVKKLSPYNNYTIRIRAATSVGSGNWSDPILVRTLSGVPLPPKNIERMKVTNLTICIKWEEPSPFKGPIVSYTVRWQHAVTKRVNSESAVTSPHCIQKLEPYTFYDIAVQAKTTAGLGNWSENERIQTAIGIPASVKLIEAYNKTAWSIYLTWSPPDPSNGPLKDYEVKWGEDSEPDIIKNLTKNTFLAVENLTPFTKYIFQISASTEVEFGPPSVPFLVQTEVAVPSAPVNLEVVSATNISLTLKWQKPVAPNGPISGYNVSWKTTYEDDSARYLEVKSLQHTITGLVPYKNYSIQVAAKTSAGAGPWSDVVMGGTKIGVPKPAQVSKIAVENSRTISIEWSTVEPYPGPTNYTVEVWRKASHCNPGSGSILEKHKEGSRGSGEWRFTRPETVEGLTPYSEYYVRILLKTIVAETSSINSSVVKTSPDSPGPPRKVESECKESTETMVRWKTPLHPNGKIVVYLVRYGVEYSGWSEDAVTVQDECRENYSLKLTDLRPERKYKIYVRAKAEDVEENGDEAAIKGYCVLPAGVPPVGDITSLTIHGSGPHSLVLDWTQAVFSDSMGDIIHYAVIIGVSEAVGNASSGRIAETFPSWANYSEGFTSIYQATPLEWNPFDEEQEDPLLCEEIKADDPEKKTVIRCKIGVDKECSSSKPYCNGPLKPDTRYGVKLRAFTRGGFSETDPLYTITDAIQQPSSIAGIIVGVVVVLLMVSAFIVFTLILKRKGKLLELRLAILARFGQQPTAPQQPAEQVLQLEACPAVAHLTIQNFAEHVRLMMSDSHLRFSQEFETLKKNSPKFPCSIAEMDENRPKNRWLNIFPYDHSRVKLLPLGDEPGSDFVNANYVPGYSSLREYIATQGPLVNTVDDFWRMVWEQSVSMIVMLTQCVERGKNKCEQYWPDAGEAKHYGDMQVRTISESMLSCYIIRLFHVQLGSQERRVKQMHFTHWPDFGCPESPDDLINFIRAVRDHLPRFKPGPIVVHCSAGVGRTGTFIAVDRLSQQLRSTDTIDIFGTVMELRHHRVNMVQTEDQYIYIHLCVKQLVDDINQPRESEYEEAIYSNIGMEKDTGV